jgi:hypothetical protein
MSDSKSELTIDINAQRESPTRTTVETRGFELTVDEPEEMGGTNKARIPWSTCWWHRRAVSMPLVNRSHRVDLEINQLEIAIEGDFNQSAFAGDDDDQIELQDITVTMDIDADADEETITTWTQ